MWKFNAWGIIAIILFLLLIGVSVMYRGALTVAIELGKKLDECEKKG